MSMFCGQYISKPILIEIRVKGKASDNSCDGNYYLAHMAWS